LATDIFCGKIIQRPEERDMKKFLASALAIIALIGEPAVAARKTGGHKAKRVVKKKTKTAKAASVESRAPAPVVAPPPPAPEPTPAPAAPAPVLEPIASVDTIKFEQLKADNESLLAQVRELENKSGTDENLQKKYDDLAGDMSYSRSKCRAISDSLLKQAADGLGVSLVSSIVGTTGSAVAVAGNIVQRVGNKDEKDKFKACAEAIAKNASDESGCKARAELWLARGTEHDSPTNIASLNSCRDKGGKTCEGVEFIPAPAQPEAPAQDATAENAGTGETGQTTPPEETALTAEELPADTSLEPVAIEPAPVQPPVQPVVAQPVAYTPNDFCTDPNENPAEIRRILNKEPGAKDCLNASWINIQHMVQCNIPIPTDRQKKWEGGLWCNSGGEPANIDNLIRDAQNERMNTAETEALQHYAWAAYRATFASAAENGDGKKPFDKNKLGRIMTITGNAVGTAGGAVTTGFSIAVVAKMKDLIAQVRACRDSFNTPQ
jgi:hypothetical protein